MSKTNEEYVEEYGNKFYPNQPHNRYHEEADWLLTTLEAKDKECDERVREEMRTIRQGITDYVNQKFSEGVIVDPVELYEALNPTKTDKQEEINN